MLGRPSMVIGEIPHYGNDQGILAPVSATPSIHDNTLDCGRTGATLGLVSAHSHRKDRGRLCVYRVSDPC